MDRLEAYSILEQQLRELGINPSTEIPASMSIRGESGVLYEMCFELSGCILQGTITNNNPQKFELLQESVDLREMKTRK